MTGSLHIGLAAIGSAIGVGIIGMKAAEATGEIWSCRRFVTKRFCFAALAEGVVFIAIFAESVIAQAHSVGQVTARRFPLFKYMSIIHFLAASSESGDCGH